MANDAYDVSSSDSIADSIVDSTVPLFYRISKNIAHAYSFLWVCVLWLPYFIYYQDGTITNMLNMLTWWCWTLQVVFYTVMHFGTSPIWKWAREACSSSCVTSISTLLPSPVFLYGAVLGVVMFVFGYFCYVLFNNPDLIIKEIESGRGKGGLIQVGNILIHYYILSGIMMWSLFMFDTLRIRVNKYTESAWGKLNFLFGWVLYLALYAAYWNFDIYGIFKNYHINDVETWKNVVAGCVIMLLVVCNNAVIISLFYK